jgi:hypothetical protein
MKKYNRLLVVFLALAVFSLATVYAVVPFGASTVTSISNATAPIDAAATHDAIAGNVTGLEIFAYTTTQSWQGYYGNVTGTIQLADGSDNVMYNWSLTSPEGEIYASEESSVNWWNIQCFNHTAANSSPANEDATRGGTSQLGLNMTEIENRYGIAWDDVDGLNETFAYNGTQPQGEGLIHDLFYTNNLLFTEGECLAAHLFDSSDSAADNNFQEVLLYDPDNEALVFASILDEEDPEGFDNVEHDFQMIVLEDGHGTDISTRTYYFYVEIE